MSAELGLVRFDTRRAVQTDERSEQTDFRAVGAREHGQLALDELDRANRDDRTSFSTQARAEKPSRADLEAALDCTRATINGLREEIRELEAERDRPREETRSRAGR